MSRGISRVPPNWRVLRAALKRRKNRINALRRNDGRDEAYARLPRFLQPLISLISGMPPSGQEPLVLWSLPKICVCVCVLVLTGLVSAGIGASMLLGGNLAGTGLLVPGWMLTVGGFRATMTTILHEIVHALEPKCKRDSSKVYDFMIGWVGEAITILLVLPPLRSYYEEHVLNHHVGQVFCTLKDPDAAFLHRLGFRPGMSKADLWRQFWFNLLIPISPLYRLYLEGRTRGQVASRWRFVVTLIVWSALVTTSLVGGVGGALLYAFVVPCFFGIPAAALAQFASEHNWLVVRKTENRHQYLHKTCRGRLFLDPSPSLSLPLVKRTFAWSMFFLRLFFVHLPSRLMVCPFDLGAGHDLHHYGEPSIRKDREAPSWATCMNAGYFRRWVEANCAEDIALVTYWSLFDALDSVFDSYSMLDPNDPAIQEGQNTDVLPVVQGM